MSTCMHTPTEYFSFSSQRSCMFSGVWESSAPRGIYAGRWYKFYPSCRIKSWTLLWETLLITAPPMIDKLIAQFIFFAGISKRCCSYLLGSDSRWNNSWVAGEKTASSTVSLGISPKQTAAWLLHMIRCLKCLLHLQPGSKKACNLGIMCVCMYSVAIRVDAGLDFIDWKWRDQPWCGTSHGYEWVSTADGVFTFNHYWGNFKEKIHCFMWHVRGIPPKTTPSLILFY